MNSIESMSLELNKTNDTELFLVDFVIGEVSTDDKTRQKIKEILFDTIGVMIAGARTVSAKTMAGIASKEMSGNIPLLSGGSASVFGATFANSATSYSLDLDTVYEPSTLHIAAVLVPMILSLSAEYRLSLKEVIDAFHVGFNLASSFGDALTSKAVYARYFHPTTIAGALGASGSSSRILARNKRDVLNSLRLVSTMLSGLTSVFNEYSHQSAPIQVANSAFSGIRATVLAREGINGPPLFYKKSVFYPFSGRQGSLPEAKLIRELREGNAELKTSFKRHSACLFLQGGIDAALELKNEIGHLDKNKRIELIVDPATVDLIDNAGDVTHNAQLVLSMALRYGRVSYEDYQKAITDPEILHMKGRVRVSRDNILAGHYPKSLPAIVRLISKNGDLNEVRRNYHEGHFKNPMNFNSLKDKFLTLIHNDKDTYRKLDSLIFGDENVDSSKILSLMKKGIR